ncbi:MAG: hypothetical protein ACOC44_15145 [Promethearchaeia archaeon]
MLFQLLHLTYQVTSFGLFIRGIISKIYRRFWHEYSEEIKNFQDKITPFQKFTEIIESLDLSLV